MILFNERNEPLSSEEIEKVKNSIMNNLDKVKVSSKDEIEKELGDYYTLSHQNDLKKYGLRSSIETFAGDTHFSIGGIGKKILDEIKKIICAVLKADSTASDIFDAIVEALASIIPGGGLVMKILKPLIEKLVKYILSLGLGNFCGWTPASTPSN